MTPKFSVIIPTHNRSFLLKRAMKSVLSQTYNSFELIIVDDFSTDDTEKTVKELAEKDSRIRYFKLSQNSGPARARNFGVKQANYDFITFLDDDDELLPNYLEEVNRLNLNPDSVFVVHVACFLHWPFFNKETILNPKTIGAIGNSSTVSKKVFTDLDIWFDENVAPYEDRDFWIRCYQQKVPIIFIDTPIFRYYVNIPWKHKSLTTLINNGDKIYKATENFYKKHYEFFKQQGKDAEGYINYLMGTAALKKGLIQEARYYFLKAYSLSKNLKYLIGWMLSLGGRRAFFLGYYLHFIIKFLLS